MIQLDLFAAQRAPVAPVSLTPRKVMTRAARNPLIPVYGDGPDPFEVEVRGVPCVIGYSGGFCTHAINPPGSPFLSETGFRSFGLAMEDPEEIVAAIERYIDAPAKTGAGCDGKLRPWWPGYVLQWQQSLTFELSFPSREGVWNQWGPERWEDCWHRHDMRLADAIEQMREEGIDPNDVGAPAHYRGKWPRFDAVSARRAA